MMKRSLLLGIILAVCSLGIVKGQTVSDSLAIVSAQWKIESPQKGIIHKYVSIPQNGFGTGRYRSYKRFLL